MGTNNKYANIQIKGSDVYLQVNNEWFHYDERSTPLGAGAMGTVYLGRSCLTNERVAIKRIVDKYANIPSIRERARLEALLMFRHRNLVEMIGYCELNPYTGPIFIISRLVQGTTIDKFVNTHLRNRQDEVKRICEMLYPVLEALEYIHSKGIVHMDVKPSNIMVENGSNVRLMDLGIAYANDLMGMSSPGLMGTPKYAAPEQFIEEGQQQMTVDKTTDIYEVGITLYELLANYNPFESMTMHETIQKHRSIELPYVQGIPNAVVDVLRKATAINQLDRFRSTIEFKNELRLALEKKTESKGIMWVVIGGVLFLIVILLILLLV